MKLPDGREVDETLYLQRFTHGLPHYISIFTHVPCRFCLRPSDPVDSTCDGCWEVTTRLEGFLQDGGALAAAELVSALLAVKTEDAGQKELKLAIADWLLKGSKK